MKNAYKDDSFGARLDSATRAKQAALARIRSQAGPGDPALEERLAARKAVVAAREARQAERSAAREAEAVRKAAERAAKELEEQAAKVAEAERLASEEQARILAVEAEKIQQKANRDARYAARKARQR